MKLLEQREQTVKRKHSIHPKHSNHIAHESKSFCVFTKML